jgi:stringent starvation protein B
MSDRASSTSTRPYLIRALYEWCTDNGFTPYIAVQADATVQVPREYVKDGEIVLNISFDATSGLKLGNDFIEFSARFAGAAREIMVPVDRVIAIYARENGQGMAFPATASALASEAADKAARAEDPPAAGRAADGKRPALTHVSSDTSRDPTDPPPAGGRGKPTLTRVK